MKIYTKTGDKGYTGLIGGSRVRKNDPRVEAYGSIDELSSFIGLLKTDKDCPQDAKDLLEHIQKTLINVNCLFAIDDMSKAASFTINSAEISLIEETIDGYSEKLAPITSFLVPGANRANALANVCRTVCRRAERRVYELELCEEQKTAAAYLNRLSDYFFVLGRILAESGDN